MATLSKVSNGVVAVPPDLDLLLHWEQLHTPRGWFGIVAASILLNLLLILAISQAPAGSPAPLPPVHRAALKKTRLYMPRDLMTQRAPNTRTPSKNIDLNSLLAVQGTQSRRAAPNPSVRHFELPPAVIPKQQPKAAPQAPKPAPAPEEVATNQPPPPAPAPGSPNGLTVNTPPPPAPPPDQPFQNVGSEPLNNHPTMAVPKASVQNALKALAQPPSGTHLEINDDNQSQPSPPPVPGIANQNATQHAAIELESDPQGADFKAYLARVLGIVRGNWRHVIPASVHMGTLRGRTVIEFIISRDGSIPKLVTADPSGSDALDRAAVAGLSMSNPLPPLPAEFKGMQIRLAFTFSYNMPASQ